VLRLVAVRVLDVGEVDVERLRRRHHRVRLCERGGERLDVEERPVGGGVHVREVEHRLDKVDAGGDRADVLERPELPYPAHHLDAERDQPILSLEPLSQLAELLDDGVDRVLARTAEQEPRMEDDHLAPGSLRDPGRMIAHPECHVQLLASLCMAHETGDRCVERHRDTGGRRAFAELGGGGVVVPELSGGRQLARSHATREERVDQLERRVGRRVQRGAVAEASSH
jgi:hypothetical protein